MKRRLGNCCRCSKVNVTIAKKLYEGSLCVACNNKRLKDKKGDKEPIGLSGKWGVFIKIWADRPHNSEVSGKPLGNVMKPIFFSHVLPSSYSKFILNPDNIMLKTQDEHVAWHSESREDLVKKDANWLKVIEKYELLKEEYIQKYGV